MSNDAPEVAAGDYFFPHRSAAHPARLAIEKDVWELTDDAGQELARFRRSEMRAVPPMADLPWRLEFANGSVFESADPRLRLWVYPETGLRRHWVNRLEDHWAGVLVAFLLLPVLILLFVYQLLPAVSEQAARRIPADVLVQLDRQVMESIDGAWLQPSTATPAQVAMLERAWGSLNATGAELERRHSSALGANAFALPGGTVVVTDQLLAVLETDEELTAVLAHELGHVDGRHGLRNVIQTLGVGALFAAVVGDVSWLAETVLVAAPTLVQQMRYSREFEEEADRYAWRQLRSRGIATSCLGSALDKLLNAERRPATAAGHCPAPKEEREKSRRRSWRLPDYLSTHPNIGERIAASGGLSCP